MTLLILYAMAAALVLTVIAHFSVSHWINKIRDFAVNRPSLLRNTTPEAALAKVDELRHSRQRLWKNAVTVLLGLLIALMVSVLLSE